VLLWQLIDSGFPAGGFAHSGGLEAAMQHGHVSDAAHVRDFARQAMAQGGRSMLPLVTAAHQRPSDVPELDELCDVFMSNPIANRASRAQGRALVTCVARSFPDVQVAALAGTVRVDQSVGHYPPLFGALCNLLGVELVDCQRAYLFITVRGVGSAAVRLGLIGAYEAQTIQADLSSHIDAVIHNCARVLPGEIAQTAPLIDLYQSTHDRLYSRLFQS
jgi:urease accessory protein